MNKQQIFSEQKELVLARLKTLNPRLKIMLGSNTRVSVTDLIGYVESNDEFGKKIIRAQINMLKILAGSA